MLNPSEATHSAAMDEQVFRIKVMTNKLQEAYQGRDVSWLDEEWLGGERSPPAADEGYEGSGRGSGFNTHSNQYPPDDEDGYGESYEEGSGDDRYSEGSGRMPGLAYEPPSGNAPGRNPNRKDNPSASPAEKPMTLTWAVAVYLLPAVFAFLGSIG